jgi:Rrf2 family protein
MLSQTAEYALRAVLHVAEHGRDRPVAVGDIAAALDVPRNYLSKTLHQLARTGVLASTFGPGGGFRLGVAAERLTLDAVVGPFDTPGARHCLLGRSRCRDSDPCPAHERWKGIAEQVRGFFSTTTVADLLAGAPPEPLESRSAPARRR